MDIFAEVVGSFLGKSASKYAEYCARPTGRTASHASTVQGLDLSSGNPVCSGARYWNPMFRGQSLLTREKDNYTPFPSSHNVHLFAVYIILFSPTFQPLPFPGTGPCCQGCCQGTDQPISPPVQVLQLGCSGLDHDHHSRSTWTLVKPSNFATQARLHAFNVSNDGNQKSETLETNPNSSGGN